MRALQVPSYPVESPDVVDQGRPAVPRLEWARNSLGPGARPWDIHGECLLDGNEVPTGILAVGVEIATQHRLSERTRVLPHRLLIDQIADRERPHKGDLVVDVFAPDLEHVRAAPQPLVLVPLGEREMDSRSEPQSVGLVTGCSEAFPVSPPPLLRAALEGTALGRPEERSAASCRHG